MKILAVIILSIILLSPANAAAREMDRVFVPDFKNATGEANGIENGMDDVIREEIMGTTDYEYVSSQDLLERWYGLKEDDEHRIFEVILTVLLHSDNRMPLIYAKQKIWRVEFMMVCGVDKTDEGLFLRSELVNIDNGRYCLISESCAPNDMKETLRRQVRYLLSKGPELKDVLADRQLDPANSVVAYKFDPKDGGPFEIEVKYNNARMEPDIEDIAIVPAACTDGAAKNFTLMTRESKPIGIKGVCKGGRLADIVTIAEPPKTSGNGTSQTTLSAESRGGYIINFTLYWKGKELKAVKVEPLVNPYAEVK